MSAPGSWAVSIVVPEEFLNRLAASGIGDGIVTPGFAQTFQLPMMGPMDLAVGMTITGVEFQMAAEHPGRLVATIRAAGTVELVGEAPMPLLPGVVRARGDVLVEPIVELAADGSFRAILDVGNSTLIDMVLEGIDGLPADADAQLQMSQMLFSALGGDLFAALADQLGSIGLELDVEMSAPVVEMGVRAGRAVITMEDGRMIVGLPGVDGLDGHADIVDVSGRRVGVGLASDSLSVLCARLAAQAVGGDLPWEVTVDTSDRRLGTRVRSTRLVESSLLPDLRTSLRTTLRPRLVDGQVEIGVREAWVELPGVPSAINRISRFVGGIASRAPLSVWVPASVDLPVRPDSDTTMRMSVTSIDVAEHGVAVTLDASW